MKIEIRGGGMKGLTIAYLLEKKKHQVRIVENHQLGGLARTTPIDGKPVEVYYHHYDKSHTYLLNLCKELGVEIEWFWGKMGLITNTWNPYKIYKNLIYQKFGHHNIGLRYVLSRPKCWGRLAYIKGSTQALIDKLIPKDFKGDADYLIDATPKGEMLPVTCWIVALDRPLTKYYWLNIADLSFPFGLVVQKNNIVYLAKYGEVKGDFIEHLPRINANFKESWIKGIKVFKDDYAQERFPIVETRGLDNVIKEAYDIVDTFSTNPDIL